LTLETQDAIKAENERKKRIAEQRKLEEEVLGEAASTSCAPSSSTSPNLPANKDVYLDIDETTRKPMLRVDPKIARQLKPHQIEGLKFMWENCFEKLTMAKTHVGSGCLLAHCMGLGKTLQVIALVHTLIANTKETGVKHVIIMLPVNVQTNWKDEVTKWTKTCAVEINVFQLPMQRKQNEKELNQLRLDVLKEWWRRGGVLLIGYKLFVMLTEGKNIKPKKLCDEFNEMLLSPGADLVICDEGHLLKNDKTNLSKAVSGIQTKRRIVLTGTPMQNNLVEYHCMVSFVKPNLLGNLKEFKNR
jgi:transcriptional regulator ATRX